MPYNLSDFKKADLYDPRKDLTLEVDFLEGKVIRDLPDKIKRRLEMGGEEFEGDYSRQDSATVTALLSHGISAEDVYATFTKSPRGKHALSRKTHHYNDYLRRTISRAVEYLQREIKVDFGRKRQPSVGDGIILTRASSVEVETPRWVWPGYIPAGKITILAGDPGLGKSTIALDLASRISRGTFLPTGGRTISGTCLVASAEDAAEDTIVPRLIGTNANLERIEIMKRVKIDEEEKFLSFPRDLDDLRATITKTGARMAIIDPFNAFLTKETDSYKDQDIRSILAPFEDIAEETGAAIVIVAHLNKREDSSILYRIGGSIGIVGAARSVLAVSSIPEKDSRVIYSLKSTLSKRPSALEYKLKNTTKNKNGTQWLGEDKVHTSSIHWIGEVDFDPQSGGIKAVGEAEETIREFLKQMVFDSEMCTEEIFSEAKQAGISKGQLLRVKDSLGIKAIKKNDSKWYWKWNS